MKPIGHQLFRINDLKRLCDVTAHRFYTRESQAILIELIDKELDESVERELIPDDIFLSLSNPEKMLRNNIDFLCSIYKEVILIKKRIER